MALIVMAGMLCAIEFRRLTSNAEPDWFRD